MDQRFRREYMNLYCVDFNLIFQATKYFRQLLSRTATTDSSTPCLEGAVEGSMVPRFIELLNCFDHTNIQVEAAWALTNIACGTAAETWMLIATGAAQKLVDLIKASTNADVRDQAVWAISNIAGDCHECREYLLKIGALEVCLNEMNRYRHRRYTATTKLMESRRNLVWALSNLCRSRATSVYNWRKFSTVVTAIVHLFNNPSNFADEELVAEACWTLAYLMDGNANWSPIEAVLNAGLIATLVRLLDTEHQNPNRVLAAVVRAIGNIVTGTSEQTQAVLDGGALPRLHRLLHRNNDSLVREVCWLISNITAGTEQQIETVFKCPKLFGDLILLAGAHRSPQVRREATWAVCNALSGGDSEHKRQAIWSGCIGPLCRSLSTCEEPRLFEALLTAIEVIAAIGRERQTMTFDKNNFVLMIIEAGGVEYLQRSSTNTNLALNLRLRCLQLLGEYFSEKNEKKETESGPIIIEFIRKRVTV